eukprot:TRINITY_DN88184_c0_g1_i1.p1 TRINITY_DN88184_c0_g1~~TRINITY_DN88184_c0_g1_i1.p1  ORF type:complete len:260 (-),score=37.75 TRINITY_DN88184_c0_g1_i1:349-1083(-)
MACAIQLNGTGGTAASYRSFASSTFSARGADGQPLIYPVPLIVRNTFIDCQEPFLYEYTEERKAASCPVSCVFEPEDELDECAAWDVKVTDSEQPSGIERSKSGPSTVRLMTEVKAGAPWRRTAATSTGPVASQDSSGSDCSTTDTAETSRPATPQHVPSSSSVTFQDVDDANQSDFPSVGSARHAAGTCKPCAFLYSKGCASGKGCEFCHLCDAGEKKRRQKEKKATFQHFNTRRQEAVGRVN